MKKLKIVLLFTLLIFAFNSQGVQSLKFVTDFYFSDSTMDPVFGDRWTVTMLSGFPENDFREDGWVYNSLQSYLNKKYYDENGNAFSICAIQYETNSKYIYDSTLKLRFCADRGFDSQELDSFFLQLRNVFMQQGSLQGKKYDIYISGNDRGHAIGNLLRKSGKIYSCMAEAFDKGGSATASDSIKLKIIEDETKSNFLESYLAFGTIFFDCNSYQKNNIDNFIEITGLLKPDSDDNPIKLKTCDCKITGKENYNIYALNCEVSKNPDGTYKTSVYSQNKEGEIITEIKPYKSNLEYWQYKLERDYKIPDVVAGWFYHKGKKHGGFLKRGWISLSNPMELGCLYPKANEFGYSAYHLFTEEEGKTYVNLLVGNRENFDCQIEQSDWSIVHEIKNAPSPEEIVMIERLISRALIGEKVNMPVYVRSTNIKTVDNNVIIKQRISRTEILEILQTEKI